MPDNNRFHVSNGMKSAGNTVKVVLLFRPWLSTRQCQVRSASSLAMHTCSTCHHKMPPRLVSLIATDACSWPPTCSLQAKAKVHKQVAPHALHEYHLTSKHQWFIELRSNTTATADTIYVSSFADDSCDVPLRRWPVKARYMPSSPGSLDRK